MTVPLGGTTKAFNGGDSSRVIGSVGNRLHVLSTKGGTMLLALGMVVLGLVTFAAMLGFVILCDRV